MQARVEASYTEVFLSRTRDLGTAETPISASQLRMVMARRHAAPRRDDVVTTSRELHD